tara:strand:+ start:780 stop:1307 length:528 start_codon:yes stop_codon:yes gene_type:complete
MEDNTFYAHVHVDIPHEYMKHVIGKHGRWFKLTMEKCGVSSIWFNKHRNIVEIWGPFNCLHSAVNEIRYRIQRIKERCCNIEITCDNTYVSHDEYTELLIPNNEYIKLIIGYKGINLKHITRISGASFIWYDKQRSSFQIWGEPSCFETTKKMIIEKMDKIMNETSNETINEKTL